MLLECLLLAALATGVSGCTRLLQTFIAVWSLEGNVKRQMGWCKAVQRLECAVVTFFSAGLL